MGALVPLNQDTSIDTGEVMLSNSPHKQMKAIKSMNALAQANEDKSSYKLRKVDQSFKKGERAVGKEIKGVRQII